MPGLHFFTTFLGITWNYCVNMTRNKARWWFPFPTCEFDFSSGKAEDSSFDEPGLQFPVSHIVDKGGLHPYRGVLA